MSFSPFMPFSVASSTPSGPTKKPSHWGSQNVPIKDNETLTFKSAMTPFQSQQSSPFSSFTQPTSQQQQRPPQQYQVQQQQRPPQQYQRPPQQVQQHPPQQYQQQQQQQYQVQQQQRPPQQYQQQQQQRPPQQVQQRPPQFKYPNGNVVNQLLPNTLPTQTQTNGSDNLHSQLKDLLKKPIIIYSNKCKHSNIFLDGLSKHKTLYKNFVKINIDAVSNPNTGKLERPRVFYDIQNYLDTIIQKVPTIIVEQGEYILTDKDAFKWLEYNLVKDKDNIIGFSQAEMSLFSDKYADFGSTPINMMDDEHVKHQNFVFVKDGLDKISTPRDDDLYIRSQNSVEGQRTQIDNIITSQQKNMGKLDLSDQYTQQGYTQDDVSRLEHDRDYTKESGTQKTTIDFMNPNLGYSGQTQQDQTFNTVKKNDLDNRFEQMQMQRDSFTDSGSSRPTGSSNSNSNSNSGPGYAVDFNTGQVIYDTKN